MIRYLAAGTLVGFEIAPGPIWFLCARQSIERGWLSGFVSGLGVATADGLYAAIAIFGVAAAIRLAAGRATWLELEGGLVLIALGMKMAGSRVGNTRPRSPPEACWRPTWAPSD